MEEEFLTYSVYRREKKLLLQECWQLSVDSSHEGGKIVMNGLGAPWKINDTLLIPLRVIIIPFKWRAPLDELPLQ